MTKLLPQKTSHVLACLFFCFFSCTLYAEKTRYLDVTIQFSENDLIFQKANGYDLVEINHIKSHLEGTVGEPYLPVYSASILLPAGATVVDVRTEVEQEAIIDGFF